MSEGVPNIPDWGPSLASSREQDIRNIAVYGGRAGGKSETFGRTLVKLGTQQTLLILCCREVQNSIADSSKGVLENAIREEGLSYFYTIRRNEIEGMNGTRFIFRGLSNRTDEQLRSIVGIDIAWIEEAQAVSEESWHKLTATVRKERSQIWVSFNPHRATDIVYRMFVSTPKLPPRSRVLKVNYDDNPFVTRETLEEVAFDREYNPELYRWKWLGELEPDMGVKRVLLMRDLLVCVDLYPKHKHLADDYPAYVGLDVADTGPDKCALAVRRGPCLVEVETWRGTEGTMMPTTRKAHAAAERTQAHRLYYDSGGVGFGVREDLNQIADREGRLRYYIEPVKFGESPMGPDVRFDMRQTNKEAFARRNAQLAWAVKIRSQNTARLANGEDVEPTQCLFINPALLKAPDTQNLLEQLNQPIWDDDGGKYKIDKAPEDEPSPDMYDATILSFAEDSRSGLRHHRLG